MIFPDFDFNFNLIYNINYLLAGIIFSFIILFFLIDSKKLYSKFHSIFWISVLIFILSFNICSDLLNNSTVIIYDIITFFLPFIAILYINLVKYNKITPLLLLLIFIPFSGILFKSTIVLFYLYYDFLNWLSILIYSIVIYKKNKNNNISKYILFWSIVISLCFILNVVINLILSIIFYYPVQIIFILPIFLSIALIVIFIYFYKINTRLTDEDLTNNVIIDRHSVMEKLAASLIHEIKNPIAAIQSLTQQIYSNIDNLDKNTQKKYLDIISKDIERIKNLSDSFLKTIKKDINYEINNNQYYDIYIQLISIYDLIRFDLQKKEVKLNIDKNIVNKKVNLTPYQIRQIFLNLIYNSIEANAKNISIYTNDNNSNFEIFIEDDGDGITDENIKNLFIPYKSTKENGTGLGLSICKNILQKNNSSIELVNSKKGKTIFKIKFNNVIKVNNHEIINS